MRMQFDLDDSDLDDTEQWEHLAIQCMRYENDVFK